MYYDKIIVNQKHTMLKENISPQQGIDGMNKLTKFVSRFIIDHSMQPNVEYSIQNGVTVRFNNIYWKLVSLVINEKREITIMFQPLEDSSNMTSHLKIKIVVP